MKGEHFISLRKGCVEASREVDLEEQADPRQGSISGEDGERISNSGHCKDSALIILSGER